MRGVHFIAFIGCLFSLALRAQDHFYSTQNYTALNGLPQSQVKGIVEDRNGYLWAGTEGGGLARFDGRDFKVYTTLDGLLTNQVASLLLDRKDNIWVLHPRGVTRFDGLNFKKISVCRYRSPFGGSNVANVPNRRYSLCAVYKE